MKRFSKLIKQLDETSKINTKVAALADYFDEADGDDKLWTIALLSHRRPRRPVTTTQLREWAAEFSGLPPWLFEESYQVVGDLAETIALVLPKPTSSSDKSLTHWIDKIRELRDRQDEEKKAAIHSAWQSLDATQRFVFNKLITGAFRIGLSQKLMVRALARSTGIEENLLSLRLMGDWHPDDTSFQQLVLEENPGENLSRPYPFYLAYALEGPLEELGEESGWLAEDKWDGIRGQLVCRAGKLHVWSRGEELVTDKYPEYEEFATQLPGGTVLDGEIMPWKDGRPLSFNLLQKRIGRKNLTKAIMKEVPVVFIAYDLLECRGEDIRTQPFSQRRELLEGVIGAILSPALKLSPPIEFDKWSELPPIRASARERDSEGLMLKRLDSGYRVGRRKGDWWKWKVDPLTIDGVLLYAQRGHGRRSNLFTDYTFAVWDGDKLVPFTKAYSGLTDAEFREITNFVQRNTLERFGPVRVVEPRLVFEIAFEGIARSSRHKSGVSLRFPRMKRWRKDKHPQEANTLQDLIQMLGQYG